MAKLRKKVCHHCHMSYRPRSTTQKACSYQCAIALAGKENIAKSLKEAKREMRLMKDRTKGIVFWKKKAQAVFNKWVRMRDANAGCISCGSTTAGQYHAGHYMSTGARPWLRFHPYNCHKQCAQCNNYRSGNIAEYRVNLLKKVGKKIVEHLEECSSDYKMTREDYKEIFEYYKGKI